MLAVIIGSLFGAVSVEGVRAYWDVSSCGPNGNDFNWSWCGQKEGDCPLYVRTNQCNTGYGVRDVFHKNPSGQKYVHNGCRYYYYASYTCVGCEASRWEDQDGDTCADYDRYGWCKAYWQSNYVDRHGKTADQACCECQGGTRYCKLPNGQKVSANPSYIGVIRHNGYCQTCMCMMSGFVNCVPSSSRCRRRLADGEDGIDEEMVVDPSEYNEAEVNAMDEEELTAFLEEMMSRSHAPVDPNAHKPAKNATSDMRRLVGKPFGKPAKML